MSQTIARATLANTARRLAVRLWDPESRSTSVGLAGVIIFYLLMWLLGPHLFRLETVAVAGRPHATPKQFNIELAPDTFVKTPPKPVQPFKFVETNPDAPENIPDKTNNFAAQNQQVAQETPTPNGASDRPALEGKKDFDSTQIVSGQLVKPVEQMEAVPENPTPPREASTAAPKAEQNPLPGFEKKDGEDKLSYGTNLAPLPDNARPIPQKIEGEKNVPLVEGATAAQPPNPQKPRPRPQLVSQLQTRPAILAENKFGTQNIGKIGVDARWSNYGAYLQKMINVVQVQWERILAGSILYPPVGTTVTVKFVMDAEGRIARIVNVESSASTESASRACISAISDRAPYGPWTDDMRAVLGEEQEMTFTFFYQ